MESENVTPDNSKHAPAAAMVVCPELVEYVAKTMALGFRKWELKKKIETELGVSLSIKTYEVLRNKARAVLKDILLTPEEHKCNAIEMIYQVAQDDKAFPSHKLRAAELLLSTAQSIPAEQANNRAQQIRDLLKSIDETIGDEDATHEME